MLLLENEAQRLIETGAPITGARYHYVTMRANGFYMDEIMKELKITEEDVERLDKSIREEFDI